MIWKAVRISEFRFQEIGLILFIVRLIKFVSFVSSLSTVRIFDQIENAIRLKCCFATMTLLILEESKSIFTAKFAVIIITSNGIDLS